ncbi:MAG TPA: hypothetical protein V6C69_17395 [Trichormus sp.]|jgi:hypothetical protein
MPPRDSELSNYVHEATKAGSQADTDSHTRYLNFMDVVDSARSNYGSSSDKFQTFTNKTANHLYDRGDLRDMNLNWLHGNIDRFDIQGKHKLNLGEIDLAMRTDNDAFDQEMLREARVELQNSGKNTLSVKDSDHLLQGWTQQKDTAAQAAAEQQYQQNSISQSNDMLGRLTYTQDGNAGNSLFAVLDDVKGGHADGKISKGDLKSYLKQYDKRASHGEPEVANFSAADRTFVQNLLNGWDSPEVLRLRGTHKVQGSDGYYDQDEGNSYITIDSLKHLAGVPPYGNLFPKPDCG